MGVSAVAVVGENVRGPKGPLGGDGTPDRVDEFGHPYHLSPARHLGRLAERRLGVRVRVEVPGTIQRTMTVSRVDAEEAEAVGRAAVASLGGESGKMVTLVRESASPYRCSTGLAPLASVAGKERRLPKSFMDASARLPTAAFFNYARPLVGGPLPRFARLAGLRR